MDCCVSAIHVTAYDEKELEFKSLLLPRQLSKNAAGPLPNIYFYNRVHVIETRSERLSETGHSLVHLKLEETQWRKYQK